MTIIRTSEEATRGSFLAQLFRHFERGVSGVGAFSGATARPVETYMKGWTDAFGVAALMVELVYREDGQFTEDCLPDISGPVNSMLRSLMQMVKIKAENEDKSS